MGRMLWLLLLLLWVLWVRRPLRAWAMAAGRSVQEAAVEAAMPASAPLLHTAMAGTRTTWLAAERQRAQGSEGGREAAGAVAVARARARQ